MEKWMIKNKKADFKDISEHFNISEVMARLIVNRGYNEEEEIYNYIYGTVESMNKAENMKDMDKACLILKESINQGRKVRVVGDYDVDGIMSAYILTKALKYLGSNVDYEIPDRVKDGYGINISIIEEAYKAGINTIITCDNGIAAIEPIKRAKELGMTVIVTDHHDILYSGNDIKKIELLPEADAIVNPKQCECKYPFKNLCGAAVAYKLVKRLYTFFDKPNSMADEFIEYAGIATVCDVMDLVYENRIIVRESLKKIKNTSNFGLKALIECNNINIDSLSSYHLGYIIGPCLNASGRLDTAKKGLELLFTQDKEEAYKKALELKILNDTRKEMTQLGLSKAINKIQSQDMLKDKVLVVYLEDCHESLAGIIAGRIREKYNKPVFILTDSKEIVKGSGRSIENYSMFDELVKCQDLLLKFGGHPMAAGLSLEKHNVEKLRITLNNNTILKEEDFVQKISIDIVMPLGYISEHLIEELAILEPFGKENTKPVFAERNLCIKRAFRIGKNNNVLKLKVINEYNKEMDAIYFGDIDLFENVVDDTYGGGSIEKCYRGTSNDVKFSATYYPSVNDYNGIRTLQITIMNYLVG